MVRLQVNLTNEQLEALVPALERVRYDLAKRMGQAKEPRSRHATVAYTALERMYQPLRKALTERQAQR